MPKYNPRTTFVTDGPEGDTTANKRLGGWVAKTNSWFPIDYILLRDTFRGGYPVNVALDWITQAAEAGALTGDNIYDKAFQVPTQWEQFAEDVAEYDGWWYNERHHYAFDNLGVGGAETASYRELSDEIYTFIEWNTVRAPAQAAARLKKHEARFSVEETGHAECPIARPRKVVTKSKGTKKLAKSR